MPRRLVASAATAILTLGVLIALPAPAAQATDTNCPTAASSYADGTGTAGDPFLISTPAQLQRLRDHSADWSKEVRLTDDIDMSSAGSACTWSSTIGNPDLAMWTGTFDGNGHVVSGLDISITGSYVGFIAYLGAGAVVRDLGFTGDVHATKSGVGNAQAGVGGLVGWTLGSTILRSFATGDVSVNISASADINMGGAMANPIVGGLVGTSQGTVSDSYATGDVSVTASAGAMGFGTAVVLAQVGGLLGSAEAGSSIVVDSYSTGAVTSSASAVGGGSQSIAEWVGGSIGSFNGTYASATGVVWDTVTSGRANGIGSGTSAGVTGKTTSQMTTYSTFTGLNWDITDGYSANTVWSLCPALNDGAPVLSRFASNATCYFPPLIPAFSSPTGTSDGFQVSVTNYDDSWAWIPSVSAGAVTLGIPIGSVLPITVTGLEPGSSATVTLTTNRTRYPNGTASVSGQALPPPPPVTASEPRSVTATALPGAARVAWDPPSTSGSFPVTHYLVEASPGRNTCLSETTSCVVSGLTPGTAYAFTVQALNGAGWSAPSAPSNVVVPSAPPAPRPVTLLITGSRTQGMLSINGTSTGLEMGATVTAWSRPLGGELQRGRQVPVSSTGTFTWSRHVSSRTPWSVFVTAAGVRSNLVILR